MENHIENQFLTTYQIEYWRDPEKKRRQQREKYARYPKKIYAMNRSWQKKNASHFKMLCKFGYEILKAKKLGDVSKVSLLQKARDEYKLAWRRSKIEK